MNTLTNISKRIQKVAVRKNMLIVFALLVVVIVLMQMTTKGLEKLNEGQGTLDMRYGYSVETVYGMMEKIGEEGRQVYQRVLGIDFVFIFVHACFEMMLISWLMGKAKVEAPWRVLNFLPVLRGSLDLIENGLLLGVITLYPAEDPVLAGLASGFTLAKWGVYGCILLTYFSLGAYTFWHGVVSKRSAKKANKTI